ncbi:hypothetical protein ACFU96_43260 [Streptomyces sp. NPDC057620]|uniref:hypothetical protein n=1 Tax=Streptomyces sp. NPDC057620 TaxID=3346185 RepID=UPI0036BF0BFC
MAAANEQKRDRRLEAARRLIMHDIDCAGVLAAQLNRVLAVADPVAPTLEADSGRGVERLCLDLKAFWETPDPSLTALKETEDATAYLVNFFSPLLEAELLAHLLRTREGFGAGQPPASDATVSIGYVDHARRALREPLTRLETALAPWFTPNQFAHVRTSLTGITLLTVLPLWTAYHHLHGTAAHQEVRMRLHASLAGARDALGDLYGLVARPEILDDRVVVLTPATEHLLVTLINALQAAITVKSGYLDRFSAEIQVLPPRVHRTVTSLVSERDARVFRRTGKGADMIVSLGPPPPSTDGGNMGVFPYLGALTYEGSARTFARSFFALPRTWERLVDCSRLVSQAGFALVVTAASNPSGGRHPPHQTHRSGVEVDLDWGFIDQFWESGGKQCGKVRNLARRIRKPANFIYIYQDVETGNYIMLEPHPADAHLPSSHTGIEALSTLVVIQALILSGLRRYIYADVENMLQASDYLGTALSSRLFPKVGQKENIPVVEGLGHYHHLHAEALEGGPRYLAPHHLTELYRLALDRDKHPAFQQFLNPPADADDDTQQRVKAFARAWHKRSEQDPPLPSLLPVWQPGRGSERP